MATQDKKRKDAAQAGVYMVVIAAIVVVVNMLSAQLYHRWDMTTASPSARAAGACSPA